LANTPTEDPRQKDVKESGQTEGPWFKRGRNGPEFPGGPGKKRKWMGKGVLGGKGWGKNQKKEFNLTNRKKKRSARVKGNEKGIQPNKWLLGEEAIGGEGF